MSGEMQVQKCNMLLSKVKSSAQWQNGTHEYYFKGEIGYIYPYIKNLNKFISSDIFREYPTVYPNVA